MSSPAPPPSARGDRPNIVWLVVESTDGRTWTPGYQNDVLTLPSIRKLQAGGLEFRRHYANAPVCCPSRATFWSGRHASNIPHAQASSGLPVAGAWNNYEGLPSNFSDRIDQVLARATNYNIMVSGKRDWATGGHTDNVRLGAWMMNAEFPYDVNASGGWYTELPHWDCASSGSVKAGGGPRNGSAHAADWNVADTTTAWMRKVATQQPDVPFFAYSGMSIVHPPYATNGYWDATIERSKVEVPEWRPLLELHPCDFQSSMLKGCTPADADAAAFYSRARRREVRAKYYAMINEFDAMVGQYLDTVDELGVGDRTVFIVTSDHGDMQMEKQQFYKMVPYDASASVPMVILDGRPGRRLASPAVVDSPTQLIDLYQTILELAQVADDLIPRNDGYSLVPMMMAAAAQHTAEEVEEAVGTAAGTRARAAEGQAATRPNFVVSQFHGDDIAMSWFLVVKRMNASATFKFIVWGTGAEVNASSSAIKVPSECQPECLRPAASTADRAVLGARMQVPALLFHLRDDPDEEHNLIGTPEGAKRYAALVAQLDADLRSVVDYPEVARAVAQYGIDSLRQWVNATPDWQAAIHAGLRWDAPWQQDPEGSLAAVQALLAQQTPTITPCRLNLTRAASL